MSSKHIALFIRYLPIGGIQRIVVRLANEFARRGHKVDIVLAKGEGALRTEVGSGVRLVNLNKPRVWMALPSLLKYLRREKPDVLFSAEDPVNLVAIAASLFQSARLRVVISVRSNIGEYASSGEVWYGPYITHMVRALYPMSAAIIAVSKGVLDNLSKISPRAAAKGVVVYNPVVTDDLHNRAATPLTHPWFVDRTRPIVLGVGRLTVQKNFRLLIDAFALMRESVDARLVIIGDGNQRPNLEMQISEMKLGDTVALLGFVENPYPFMARASLFVLSSSYEGFGSVVVEALACGCPVVSTDCPSGPSEILEGGKWGRLVPVDDERALAEAMHLALTEVPDTERLRRRAMDFSAEKAVEEYLDVLLP